MIADDEELDEEDILADNFDSGAPDCWRTLEKRREKKGWLPWRPDYNDGEEEEDCEDDERIVKIEDIEKFMWESKVKGRTS